MFGLTDQELRLFKKLNSPIRIQNALDSFPVNWEKKGDGYMSPRKVLREKKMHCFEGALFAATALWVNGQKPLIFDLQAPYDEDHVVALYRENGYWGAISKTNHATLRFRDPIYKNLRELALSYFHEYFNDVTGMKALRAYSTKPFDLSKFGYDWITTEEDLYHFVELIDDAPHTDIIPKNNERFIRKADPMEMKAGKLTEWKKSDPRT